MLWPQPFDLGLFVYSRAAIALVNAPPLVFVCSAVIYVDLATSSDVAASVSTIVLSCTSSKLIPASLNACRTACVTPPVESNGLPAIRPLPAIIAKTGMVLGAFCFSWGWVGRMFSDVVRSGRVWVGVQVLIVITRVISTPMSVIQVGSARVSPIVKIFLVC